MTLPTIAVEAMFGAGPFDVPGDNYLFLTGLAGSRAATPDHSSLDITGDIDVRIDIQPNDWRPPASVETIGKQLLTGNQRSWVLYIGPDGTVRVRWSPDGTAENAKFSTVAPSIPPTGRLALRATLDVDNGASGHTVTFYTAPNIAGTWTQLGAPVITAGTTSIFASTATLSLGDVDNSGFAPMGGRCYAAQVRSGIGGTIVANPDFAAQTPGTLVFVDSAGRTWTIVGGFTGILGFNWQALPVDRAMRLAWESGRTNELDKFPPGRASVTLRNHDRRYDPEHTSGPHAGLLLPRVPIRFRINGIDQFYGFVDTGWKQSYQKPISSRCDLDLVDILGVLDAEQLPGSAYETEILADAPSAWWRLDENAGTQMADSSGNGLHGRIDNGELGQPPILSGSTAAFLAPHVGDNRGEFKGEGLPVAPPVTLEAWVKFPRDLVASHMIVAVQRDQSLGSSMRMFVTTAADGSPDGELVVEFRGLSGFYKARGHTRVDDDKAHHVAMTMASTAAADIKLYVDGIEQTKTLISGTTGGTWTSHLIWTVGNLTANGFGDFGLGGLIDEVAVYGTVLPADRIVAHHQAGATAFAGESSGARINRVLDVVGVPAVMRDIAVGDTFMGPADYGGKSAGAYLGEVIESEQGVLFVDHRNGGLLKFRGRYARLTETRSKTSQATFTDNPDGVNFYRPDLAPDPNTLESVVNVVNVGWRGGTETVVDEVSRARFGPQSRAIATDAPTPQTARSAGAWLLARHGEPRAQIRRLPVAPGGDAGLAAEVLDLRVSDRVTVERHPQGIGGQIVNSLIVEGIANEINANQSWYTTYKTSNADDTKVWIWGTSAWDVDTYWG